MQSLFAGVIHQVAQIEQQRLAQILDSFFAQPVLQRKECMTGKTQRTDGYTNITGTFRGVGSTVIDEQDVRAFVDKARRS